MKIRHSLEAILVTFIVSLMLIGTLTTPVIGAEKRRVVIFQWGGSWEEAAKKAFGEEFTRETGIELVWTGPPDFGKVKAMVESGKVDWDVGQAGTFRVFPAAEAGLLEPIDYSIVDKSILDPTSVYKYGAGGQNESAVIGYRTDVYGDKGPKTWKDFWDVKRFPGPRCLRREPVYTLEAALLADGVAPDKLYPLDEVRAFASLDRIKPHVTVWWKTGAQSQTVIKNREVNMVCAWNGRMGPLIDQGDPIAMSWDQAFFTTSVWFVIKNTPRKKDTMEFINFTGRAKNQAIMSKLVYYGPTNLKAMDYIDEKTAKLLPTYPEHFKKKVMIDAEYWAKNQTRLTEKLEAWLMK